MADPLIILGPPRSFTSVVCAMLGQHPQMYGLPEMNLFICEKMLLWWLLLSRGTTIGAHGLLRVIAQINWGIQTEATISQARRWVRQRLRYSTGDVFMEVAERMSPLVLVDKSPITVERMEGMQRALRIFPGAKFLHLLRHPLGHGQSVVKVLEEFPKFSPWPRGLEELMTTKRPPQGVAKGPRRTSDLNGLLDLSTDPPTLDPQMRWYKLHSNILAFLAIVPPEQQMQVRGEDLLTEPDHHLREIASWIGLRVDAKAVEAMKHPERSPFACLGPSNAKMGNDPNFLQRPALRTGQANAQSLEGPLPWRRDGLGFRTEVRALAQQFGYS